MKYKVVNLMEEINQSVALNSLKNTLQNLFEKYDRASMKYRLSVYDSKIDLDSENNSEDILNQVNELDRVKENLDLIIQILNAIQTIFEKLNYTSSTSTPNDVSETNFLKQLEQYSKQALNLIEDFTRESFQSFYENTSYLTSLAEVHYNNLFGELQEQVKITDNAEEMLETTEEYLESLPKIETNELK